MFMDLVPPEGMYWSGFGVPRYGRIHSQTPPGLRERGMSEEQITQMLVENPRRYFSRRAASAS